MGTSEHKLKAAQQTAVAKQVSLDRTRVKDGQGENSSLQLQRTIGNQAVQRLLQPKAVSLNHAPDAAVTSHVNAATSATGLPLGPETRPFMEQRFGHDFGNVRIHIHPQATYSAAALNARAYTLGHHIVFGAGEYAPQTHSGRSLLAHELAHVVQQAGAPSALQTKLSVGSATDSSEHAADAAADTAMDTRIPSGSAALRRPVQRVWIASPWRLARPVAATSSVVGRGERSDAHHYDVSKPEIIRRNRLFRVGIAALTPPYALRAINIWSQSRDR
jgi:Domain of unknown function (DUF4157)